MLDSDDIAYSFERRDLQSLHDFLQAVFAQSERNPYHHYHYHHLDHNRNQSQPQPQRQRPLAPSIVARGGGRTYTTAYKLQHDLEQAEYLLNVLLQARANDNDNHNNDDNNNKKKKKRDKEVARLLGDTIIPTYRAVLQRIPPLEELLPRTQGLFALSSIVADTAVDSTKHDASQLLLYNTMKQYYNTALHVTDMSLDSFSLLQMDHHHHHPPETQEGSSPSSSSLLLNPQVDMTAMQKKWQEQKIIHIDNLLTPAALQAIQTIMWESTVWYQTKLTSCRPSVIGGLQVYRCPGVPVMVLHTSGIDTLQFVAHKKKFFGVEA